MLWAQLARCWAIRKSMERMWYSAVCLVQSLPWRHQSDFDCWIAVPNLEALRAILRLHIFDNWPLGAGDQMLDYVLPARRLHLIRTAAKTHNLHPKRLRRILTDAGTITATDLPDFEVLFSAVEAQEVLVQASGSVSFSAAQKRPGMTLSQMKALVRAGILKPGEGGEKARPRVT